MSKNTIERKPLIKPGKVGLPYKRSPEKTVIAENTENAARVFKSTAPADMSKYNMILVAADRSRDLFHGAETRVKSNHRATVTALLEIEAGEVKWDYESQFGNPKVTKPKGK